MRHGLAGCTARACMPQLWHRAWVQCGARHQQRHRQRSRGLSRNVVARAYAVSKQMAQTRQACDDLMVPAQVQVVHTMPACPASS